MGVLSDVEKMLDVILGVRKQERRRLERPGFPASTAADEGGFYWVKPLEIQQAPGYNSARGEYCGYGKNQGSITLRQIGLVEALEKRGHVLYNNWHGGKTAEERKKTLKSRWVRMFSLQVRTP